MCSAVLSSPCLARATGVGGAVWSSPRQAIRANQRHAAVRVFGAPF